VTHIVKVNFRDNRPSVYVQGFDYSGMACTGVIQTAQHYPEWVAIAVRHNAEASLLYAGLNVSECVCVEHVSTKAK
jgi:hypothetical protein